MAKMFMFLAAAALCLIGPAGHVHAKETGGCGSLERMFPGKVKEERSVCKVEFVRRDLQVTHMGLKMPPELMELALMANFGTAGGQTVLMGEFALLEGEVNPVIDALRRGGAEITALHNHMMGEHPRILYLHFQGMGDRDVLARAVQNAVRSVAKGT
ncbi:DUF1259 domain-containing protein [Cohnella caldifontis]|uniref:DUF1259 domain-containing protein n=1 Tax=Cohnella caldifontis TaxID=3027471 RepID=UPI0023ED2F80|nr:DUF1259 domain-containing protein [Cohnella sp. YIM B05605]